MDKKTLNPNISSRSDAFMAVFAWTELTVAVLMSLFLIGSGIQILASNDFALGTRYRVVESINFPVDPILMVCAGVFTLLMVEFILGVVRKGRK